MIGVLASLVIVAYSGIQQRAVVASLQVDLENAAKRLKLDQVDTGAFPATLAAAGGGSGLNASNGTTYQYTVDNNTSPPTFCLTATHGTTSYYIDQNNTPTLGVCTGHEAPGEPITPDVEFTWTPMTGIQNPSGYMPVWTAVATSGDGQIIYGWSSNGNSTLQWWRSLDRGQTWSTNPRTGANSLVGLPSIDTSIDGSVIIASGQSGSGYTRQWSQDGGATWAYSFSSSSDSVSGTVAISESGSVAAVSSRYLRVSYDKGATLQSGLSYNTPGWRSAVSGDGTTIMAISTGTEPSQVRVSYNGGATWAASSTLSAPVSVTNYPSIALSRDASTVLLTSGTSAYVSNDGGLTWTERLTNLNMTTSNRADVAMSGDGKVMVAPSYNGYINTSIDKGVTWTQQTDLGVGKWWDSDVSADGSTVVVIERETSRIVIARR